MENTTQFPYCFRDRKEIDSILLQKLSLGAVAPGFSQALQTPSCPTRKRVLRFPLRSRSW